MLDLFNLINMCLGVFRLGFILFGTLGFLDLGDYFPLHFRELFIYYLLKYFLMAFIFVFFFWDSYDSGRFTLSQRSLRLSSFLLILFFFFPLCFIYFHHFIFYLTYPIFCLCYPHRSFLENIISYFWLLLRLLRGSMGHKPNILNTSRRLSKRIYGLLSRAVF